MFERAIAPSLSLNSRFLASAPMADYILFCLVNHPIGGNLGAIASPLKSASPPAIQIAFLIAKVHKAWTEY